MDWNSKALNPNNWIQVTLDLTDYPLPPIEQILGMLVWMVQSG